MQFILLLYLIPVPLVIGSLFKTKLNKLSILQQWMAGQFALWALFQVLAVYFILKKEPLDALTYTNNFAVQALLLVAIVRGVVLRGVTAKHRVRYTLQEKVSSSITTMKTYKWWYVIWLVLFVVQILALVFLQVNDGDDAYHMAIASVAESSGNMYTANVYAFGNTTLTYRYALAPFPIWIAYLSRISGVHTLTIAHIILGTVLVTMSYVIYASSAKELFGDNRKKRLQFLCAVALLYIWGNTSSHTAESFLLLRSRQGKALVAGIVFPAIIYLLIHIGRKLEQKQKISLMQYVLAACVILTGFLGSALGGSLVVALWGLALLFFAIAYKKIGVLLLGALSTLPGLVYAILYLLH